MIAIGGVIGVTVFSTNGEILNTAGPVGLLLALIFVAVTTICVMECLGEFVIQWPVSNAMFEYVKAFVDRDLAIVVGIAYWYSFQSEEICEETIY
jgi:amino acid transporter